jgi:hypothetical protein
VASDRSSTDSSPPPAPAPAPLRATRHKLGSGRAAVIGPGASRLYRDSSQPALATSNPYAPDLRARSLNWYFKSTDRNKKDS